MKNDYFLSEKSNKWKHYSTYDWIYKLFKISKNEEQFLDNLNQLNVYLNKVMPFIKKIDFLLDDKYIERLYNSNIDIIKYFDIYEKIKNNYKKILLILFPCDAWFKYIMKKSSIDDIENIFNQLNEFSRSYFASKPINFKLN